jgi:hypothetical protein
MDWNSNSCHQIHNLLATDRSKFSWYAPQLHTPGTVQTRMKTGNYILLSIIHRKQRNNKDPRAKSVGQDLRVSSEFQTRNKRLGKRGKDSFLIWTASRGYKRLEADETDYHMTPESTEVDEPALTAQSTPGDSVPPVSRRESNHGNTTLDSGQFGQEIFLKFFCLISCWNWLERGPRCSMERFLTFLNPPAPNGSLYLVSTFHIW